MRFLSWYFERILLSRMKGMRYRDWNQDQLCWNYCKLIACLLLTYQNHRKIHLIWAVALWVILCWCFAQRILRQARFSVQVESPKLEVGFSWKNFPWLSKQEDHYQPFWIGKINLSQEWNQECRLKIFMEYCWHQIWRYRCCNALICSHMVP